MNKVSDLMQDNLDKISVVVPIYNAENNLDRCIQSIISQTYKNIEIWLINDGSSDNSRNIINKYEQIDFRINALHQTNRGVSAARNAGMDKATGEYIVFIDADDYVDKHYIEKLYKGILKSGAEVCICDSFRYENFKWNNKIDNTQEYIFNNDSDKNKYIIENCFLGKHRYCVWNRMYSLKLLRDNTIFFKNNSLIYPEDLLFNLEVIIHISKIAWINEKLYIHEYNSCGLTNSYRKNAVNRSMKLCDVYIEELENIDKYNVMKDSVIFLIQYQFFNSVKNLIRKNNCKLVELKMEIDKLYECSFIIDLRNVSIKRVSLIRKVLFYFFLKRYSLFVSIMIFALIKLRVKL